ncbi:C-type lectin 37Db-like [Drosophila miranda]|uniref:C-type lectin 37Db-like n=1 Tax=Drosophila miranda TaxID=7229 RepID=UPI0007E88585|nr:C-type lectin 37Db-like [Drosophila miranda]
MSKSVFLLYILIAVHLQESLTFNATLSTQSTEGQCGGYCFNALKPMLDHIAANQQRWSSCDATLLESTARQDSMESQLAALKDKLSSIEAGKEVPKVNKLENFVQIGSRFFYIEELREVNWFSGTNICRQMGGFLASPRSEEELIAIKEKLKKGRQYWLGVSDLAKEGTFVSQATGDLAPLLKWSPSQPDNHGNNEHCVHLQYENFSMNDLPCTYKNYFLCEAGDG